MITSATDGDTTTSTSYDSWGQPATVTTRRGEKVLRTVRLSHDVDGALEAVNDGARTTRIDWDTEREVPQPAALTDTTALADGDRQIDLVHGTQRAFAVTNGAPVVFHTDSNGSVLRSGDTLNLAAAQKYDPFGQPGDASPDRGLELGYRGEITVDGQVHLRARAYNPTTGLFTSEDPLEPQAGETTASNWYAYANNDPLNLIDPHGKSATSDAAFGTGTALRAQALPIVIPVVAPAAGGAAAATIARLLVSRVVSSFTSDAGRGMISYVAVYFPGARSRPGPRDVAELDAFVLDQGGAGVAGADRAGCV